MYSIPESIRATPSPRGPNTRRRAGKPDSAHRVTWVSRLARVAVSTTSAVVSALPSPFVWVNSGMTSRRLSGDQTTSVTGARVGIQRTAPGSRTRSAGTRPTFWSEISATIRPSGDGTAARPGTVG
jgi:hypothetical protein